MISNKNYTIFINSINKKFNTIKKMINYKFIKGIQNRRFFILKRSILIVTY